MRIARNRRGLLIVAFLLNDVVVLAADDRAGAGDLDLDRFSLAWDTFSVCVITDRVASAQFFGDA